MVDAAEPIAACERALALLGGRAEGLAAATWGTSSLTRFANSRIHQNVTEDMRSVTLTVASEGRTARAATTRTDDAGLSELVERVLAAAALRPTDPEFPGFAPPAEVPAVEHWDDGTAGATPEQRAAVVAGFVEAAGGLETAGYCSTSASTHVLISTTGQRAVGRSSEAQIDGIARAGTGAGAGTAAGGDHPADGYAQRTSVRLADIDGAACGARAAAKARGGRDPIQLEPGAYEVVLEPRAVAQALLFPALYGFNGKAHAEGTSFAHLGEPQWDEALDLWDDATDPRALGEPFDVEGTPRRRLDLVRAGVTVGLAHDRRSARLAGADPTGNSVGMESFGGVPTHVFLAPSGAGEAGRAAVPPEQVVAGVGRGLLVTDFWYNRILDPKTQVVTGLTRNGLFLIEAGEIAGPVQNLRYTQGIVAAFGPGKVRAVGDDGELVGSEVSVMHVPTVHLAGWSFTGNARG
jgi:predicted Zn-dependent protease